MPAAGNGRNQSKMCGGVSEHKYTKFGRFASSGFGLGCWRPASAGQGCRHDEILPGPRRSWRYRQRANPSCSGLV